MPLIAYTRLRYADKLALITVDAFICLTIFTRDQAIDLELLVGVKIVFDHE